MPPTPVIRPVPHKACAALGGGGIADSYISSRNDAGSSSLEASSNNSRRQAGSCPRPTFFRYSTMPLAAMPPPSARSTGAVVLPVIRARASAWLLRFSKLRARASFCSSVGTSKSCPRPKSCRYFAFSLSSRVANFA